MKANQIHYDDHFHFMPDMKSKSINLLYINHSFGTQSLGPSKNSKEKLHKLKILQYFKKECFRL